MKPASCDLFCTVVDNYGDIGVSWRLARLLAHEHGIAVRLWVDDLKSFQRLCPELDVQRTEQQLQGIAVHQWRTPFPPPPPIPAHAEKQTVADLVIGAFACQLPPSYVTAMAERQPAPVWINLEYLSAEAWVEQCHRQPSPHPRLPLTKYFFFPGFTPATGGLLLEHGLLSERTSFQQNAAAQAAYWQILGVPQRQAEELRISLFCYENPALPGLLEAWQAGPVPVTVLVPEGRILEQLCAYFGQPLAIGTALQRGMLGLQVLPFVPQPEYDRLLWACDFNFVRGEDSCVRAQWAARPFVWHIYPQHDGVHLHKLRALAERYTAALPPDAAAALTAMWLAWNGSGAIAPAWRTLLAQRASLARHGPLWARQLADNNLALNLLDFYRQVA